MRHAMRRPVRARPMRLDREGCSYKFVAATGMYKRESGDGPTRGWGVSGLIPKVGLHAQENFLEARGWGVISRPGADANDESAEDFVGDGAAYVPAFTTDVHTDGPLQISSLGFDITPRRPDVAGLSEASADVLLRGETEKPHSGVTADGVVWTDVPNLEGPIVFCCAASGLPVLLLKILWRRRRAGRPSRGRSVRTTSLPPRRRRTGGALRRESHASWSRDRRGGAAQVLYQRGGADRQPDTSARGVR